MKIINMTTVPRNIMIFLLIAFTYALELTLLSRPSDGLHSILLTLSFAMVTVYLSNYKSAYGIFGGFLVIALIDNVVYFKLGFSTALIYALIVAFFYTFSCFVFTFLFSKSKVPAPVSFQSIITFLGASIIAFNVATIIPTLIIADATHGVNPIDVYLNDFLAGLSGMVSFGMIVLFDNWLKVKELYTKKEIMKFLGFALIYTLFLIIIFSNVLTWVTNNLGYSIIIIFYLIFAYFYHFKSLLLFNFIYIVISRILYFEFLFDTNTALDIAGFDILLAILTIIFIVVKIVVEYLENQNQELEQANDKLEVMLDSTMGLIKLSDTINNKNVAYKDQYLHDVFDIACKIFTNYDYAFLIKKGEKASQFIDSYNYDLNKVNGIKLPSILVKWHTKSPVIVKEPLKYIKAVLGSLNLTFFKNLPSFKSGIYITIYLGNAVVGAITFHIKEGSNTEFSKEDYSNIKSFQHTVNSIAEVTELNNKTNSLKDEIVLSMVRTIELFDAYTGGHSEQVAYLSFQLALELGLTRIAATEIYWAGIVHDIGKIGVGYEIINKKGKLTASEYEAIKMHPVYGYDILIESDELKAVAKLVRHHHEWYNGSGYPDGLKRDEIPLGAQILTVADAVSSMSTERPYSEIKDNKHIIEELKLYSDTQFNKKIAEAMIKLIKDGIIEDSLT